MIRLPRIFLFISSMIVCWSAGMVSAQPAKLILETSSTPVAFKLLSEDASGCDIQFELNELITESLKLDGESYQILTIVKGGMSGQDGHPGLPTYSGVIAVPEGRSVQMDLISTEEKTFSQMRLFPVQPDRAESFVINKAAYEVSGKLGPYEVLVGDPAVYLGQTIVPFVVHPVQYQADQDLVSVATRMHLRFNFTDGQKGLASRRTFETVPQSFVHEIDDLVVNNQTNVKSGTSSKGPGTYLVVTPINVEGRISSLVNWRQRQGYNVVVATVEQVGPSYLEIKNYIQDLYDTVDPPLEYILLVGDANGSITCPTGSEYLSGWNGETDHYYTTLDGDDILSDVHIGRLTVRDPTQLSNIIDKIVTYETNPPMIEDPDWFNRATLVGDPSDSGISTIYVNQWLKAQLEDLAFTQVDTIFGGNFPNLMHASLNQGGTVFGYRGFYAMSGYSPGLIGQLANGYEAPFAVLPTCDTGSFRSHLTAHSEAFLRAPNGGAIGAIALSTVGTHTRYNNCLFNGIWEGMLNTNDHHMGTALTRGKLELYNNYYLSEPESAEIWASWANLMGDPATDVWLDKPANLDVSHSLILPPSANSFPVVVTSEGSAVEGALVALYKENVLRVTGYTDAQGQVNLLVSEQPQGAVQVTVTKHNCLPYQGWMSFGDVDVYAGLSDLEFTGGNDDGLISPGELLNLRCALESMGANMAAGVTATLISHDPQLTVIDGEEFFGDIAAGSWAWCAESFQIQVSDLVKDQYSATLELVATNGNEEWISAVEFTVHAPEFDVIESSWTGPEMGPNPGDFGDLVLVLSNSGSLPAGIITAELSTESPWILVTDPTGEFAALEPGALGDNSFNFFSLQISNGCFVGHLANFELTLTLPDGLVRTTEFQLTIGELADTDPIGPDGQGYYAFDSTDISYEQAPVYEWIELNPNLGGFGTDVGINDPFFGGDETRTIDLPFTFQYYGENFDQISICSNGWVAMGETSLKQYRNFTIPCAGSPNALIAAYWDDLHQPAGSLIYYWYDEVNSRLIVQWHNLRSLNGSLQNFQLILRDPSVYPTANGDGEIVFQYKTVNNTDSINGYGTVGIQNLTGDDGLLYTYWNQYASGAAPLESGLAILFTPTPLIPLPGCIVSPELFTLTMAPDQEREETLVITNNGEQGSELFYMIEKIDPDAPGRDNFVKNMEGSTMTASISIYPVGEIAELELSVTNNSPDNEYLESVSLNVPLGVSVVSATNLVHSGIQSLTYNEATGEGVLCVWSGGFITTGNTATSTITLDFSNSSGAVVLPYVLSGDDYGGAPHSVEGSILLSPNMASISLWNPNGGEQWMVGEESTVNFNAGGGPEFLTMELDRGDGNGWQTIMENIPASETSVDWLVQGPISAQCLLRLSDREDSDLFAISDNWFTIGRNLNWVTLDQSSGTIESGLSDDVILTFNTAGMEPGSYALDLVIRQMATGTLVVPVRLEVQGDLTGNQELPRVTKLAQNHPNPFNPHTKINFALKNDGPVTMRVFDTQGRLVRTLVDETMSSGDHEVFWRGQDDDGRRLPSGMYLYRMETASGVAVRKMLLLK